jgi:hypothetical protein
MAVYKQRKSDKWWYKFRWNGELIRESTKQSNKRVAEQMEAAHKTSLAKGEVGIRERKPVPLLRDFAENDFLPYVRSTFAAIASCLILAPMESSVWPCALNGPGFVPRSDQSCQ